MPIAIEIGQRIRFYRKKRNLSQERLAELCNFHPTYIGQLERGEKNASLESIYRVTQGLQVPISQFLANLDLVEKESDNIPLEIYHQVLQLPENKQKTIQKVLEDVLEFWD